MLFQRISLRLFFESKTLIKDVNKLHEAKKWVCTFDYKAQINEYNCHKYMIYIIYIKKTFLKDINLMIFVQEQSF